MTRKEALTDLLAQVEAGEFDAQPGGDFRPRFHAFMNLAEVAFGFYGPVGLPELAWRAYNLESLGAAKALHEAVLPGWRMSVRQSEIIGDDDTFLAVVWPKDATKRESVFRPAGRHAIEGRARLIAIIKALIAMEDT